MIINNFNLGNYRYYQKAVVTLNYTSVLKAFIINLPDGRFFLSFFQKIIFTFGRFLPAV